MPNRSSGQCPVYLQHRTRPLTSTIPRPTVPRDRSRDLGSTIFSGLSCVYIWSRHISVLCLGFQPFPSAVVLLPWRRQHTALWQAQQPLPLAFPFLSTTTDIPALCLLYRYVPLAPEIQVAQLLYPCTPIPRSKQGCALGRSLTPGYNEDSEGSAPVRRCWPQPWGHRQSLLFPFGQRLWAVYTVSRAVGWSQRWGRD